MEAGVEIDLAIIRREGEFFVTLQLPNQPIAEFGPWPTQSDAQLYFDYAMSFACKNGGEVL